MPGRIRTPGLLIRSQTLYPAELRARSASQRTARHPVPHMNAAGSQRVDTIVVGAGLAGSLSALALCGRGHKVLILDKGDPPAGASAVAAGIVNPYTGIRARPIWRHDEAWAAFLEMLRVADASALFAPTGILRPAGDEVQARIFEESARTLGDRAVWLTPGAARERIPRLVMHGGALLIRRGGMIRPGQLVHAVLAQCKRLGAQLMERTHVDSFGEDGRSAYVTVGRQRLCASRVVLAPGYGWRRFAALDKLNLHAIKGQVVWVRRPRVLPHSVNIPISGHGYVAPQGDLLVVGTSYERSFHHVGPTEEESRRILERAALMWPPLVNATRVGVDAGVRVTTPRTRLPICGPVPGFKRAWVFTGLGSKGLLMSSLVARSLPEYLENPSAVPPVLSPTLR